MLIGTIDRQRPDVEIADHRLQSAQLSTPVDGSTPDRILIRKELPAECGRTVDGDVCGRATERSTFLRPSLNEKPLDKVWCTSTL